MAEFYMDNLILVSMNVWDPNSHLGDVKFISLASWMTREEAMVE